MESPKAGSKICESCARVIEPRKKWAKNWAQVKYCSERCRRNKNKGNYQDDILNLLKQRGTDKTICPSEVLSGDDKQDKAKMENVRISARKLEPLGKIEIWQKGRRVDPSSAKGPIRLKLVRKD